MRNFPNATLPIAALFAVVLMLPGCSNDTKPDDVPLGADGRDASGVEVSPGGSGSQFGGEDLGGSGYQGGYGDLGSPEDPNSPLYERIIYFDYDSSTLAPQYQTVVSNHSKYLLSHPSASISLEGHTDERGSREYNLALGEGRAQSIAELMMIEGVNPNQIQTLTYGEERAADLGSNESAWSANRLVEIVYLNL
jgi:peptidoglycan-associated lipoprotein